MPGTEFLSRIGNDQRVQIQVAQIQPPVDFDSDRIPPEILTFIFEHLMSIHPKSMLACRLTCHRFKPLIDDILEKKQLLLWNWSNANGETKPGIHHGYLERFLPMNRVFSSRADLKKFIDDMDDHPNNPFPHRGIYFRRIEVPLPLTYGESTGDWTFIEENYHNHPLWHIEEMRRHRNFRPKGHYQWNDPLEKFHIILEKFGAQLTSVILDFGFDKLYLQIGDLNKILRMTPNLQCLLIKGVHVSLPKSNDDPFQVLPNHQKLKSIKVVYSSATQFLLQAYHHQVETLQMINIQQSWYSYFEALQWSNSKNLVFGHLKHLKLGEFTSVSEFDNFTRLLRYLPDYWKKLECLSLQYSLYHEFVKPVSRLLQVLRYLPKLRELNVGVCRNTKFVIKDGEMDELEDGELFSEIKADDLIKLSLPAQFIRYPETTKKIFQAFPSLKKVKLLNHDKLLLHDTRRKSSSAAEQVEENVAAERVLGLPVNYGVESLLRKFLTEFWNIKEIEVLSINGDLEKNILSVF